MVLYGYRDDEQMLIKGILGCEGFVGCTVLGFCLPLVSREMEEWGTIITTITTILPFLSSWVGNL